MLHRALYSHTHLRVHFPMQHHRYACNCIGRRMHEHVCARLYNFFPSPASGHVTKSNRLSKRIQCVKRIPLLNRKKNCKPVLNFDLPNFSGSFTHSFAG